MIDKSIKRGDYMITIVEEKDAKFITHAGSFHADDVMATVLLEILYEDIPLARVAEIDEKDTDAFVYDIGLGKYYHHQDDKVRRDNGIAYSSVGLIWRDYGIQILEKLGIQDYIEDYFYDIDDQIIMPIDALDNGEGERISMTISSVISISNPFWNSPISGDEAFLKSVDFMRTVFHVYIEYLKDVNNNELDWDDGYDWLDQVMKKIVLDKANEANCFIFNEEGDAIDMWKEYGEEIITYYNKSSKHAELGVYDVNKMFVQPLSFTREETDEVTAYPVEQLAILMENYHKNGEPLLKDIFDTCIHSEVSRIQGMDYVEAQIDLSEHHIMILEQFVPWKGTLLKSESNKVNDIYLTVFPSQRGGWNFQGVPLSPASFDTRIKVPEEWCGKRDQELVELTGVEGARFIHPGGFIGGAENFESIMELAQRIVEYTEQNKTH